MKYLNIAFLALFTLCMISCGGDKSKATNAEDIEPMEIDEDEIIETETDETDYLEAAMTAFETGDVNLAAYEIMNAVRSIERTMGEVDDPSMAQIAITELTKIATSIKSGTIMTADEFQKTILSLELFSDDELEIYEKSIEE